jgi:arylsulfatase A-like enzyme
MSATILDLCGVDIPDYFQGNSLLPVLRGEADGSKLRDTVRCEYFEALDPFFTGGPGSYATMYRDEQYKLTVYHDQQLGELYDLQADPWEFNDLWDHPDFQNVRNELILKSFNSHVMQTTDVGSTRIAPM